MLLLSLLLLLCGRCRDGNRRCCCCCKTLATRRCLGGGQEYGGCGSVLLIARYTRFPAYAALEPSRFPLLRAETATVLQPLELGTGCLKQYVLCLTPSVISPLDCISMLVVGQAHHEAVGYLMFFRRSYRWGIYRTVSSYQQNKASSLSCALSPPETRFDGFP